MLKENEEERDVLTSKARSLDGMVTSLRSEVEEAAATTKRIVDSHHAEVESIHENHALNLNITKAQATMARCCANMLWHGRSGHEWRLVIHEKGTHDGLLQTDARRPVYVQSHARQGRGAPQRHRSWVSRAAAC